MPTAALSTGRKRREQALTARAVEALKVPGIYTDGNGLALHVLDSGTKSWRYRYRLDRKPGVAVLGTYPQMSLSRARVALEEARGDVDKGIKPALRKWATQQAAEDERRDAAATLGAITESWFNAAKSETGTWSDGTAGKTRGRIDNHIRPSGMWDTPIAGIRVADLSKLLDKLHAKSPDTCNKVRQILSGVFRFAAARGLVEGDPVATTRPGSGMRKRREGRKLAACTDLKELGAILRAIDLAQASWQVKGALHLCAFTAQRPGRVVEARWDEMELDGDGPHWRIPRDKQKNKSQERGDHIVPLAPAVVAWLRTLPKGGEYVFSTGREKHVTLEAPSKLLRASLGMAGVHTPHGFRASFSTLANQESGADGSRRFDRDDIEHILDHEVQSEVVRAYDRKRALPRLRVILEWWAGALAGAKASA